MEYEAYLDKEKKIILKAKEAANLESAYFRKLPGSVDSILIQLNEEKKFDFKDLADKIMSGIHRKIPVD